MSRRATRLELFDLRSPTTRAFHATWIAFFLCFLGWFATAPLLPAAREELGLTPGQIDALLIASLASTIVARPIVGAICDRIGPRRTYRALLVIAALPLLAMPLVDRFEVLLALRMLGGIAGASFVVTSAQTARMFAPSCVGTASATAAGWGNLGGGAAHVAMPLCLAALAAAGVSSAWGWRIAPIVPGLALLGWSWVYARATEDPIDDVEVAPRAAPAAAIALDPRVWLLALQYGACFGIEVALENAAALHFRDRFLLSTAAAGAVAGAFGGVNLFARALGGWLGDRAGARHGIRGRFLALSLLLAIEGALLALSSVATHAGVAIALFVAIGLLVAMGAGATYAVVPLLHARASGAVSGWVGAGGSIGAVLAAMALGSGRMLDGSAFVWLAAPTIALACAAPIALAARDALRPRLGTGARVDEGLARRALR